VKLFIDGELPMLHGRLFEAFGPATTNARSLNFVLVRRTARSPRADARVLLLALTLSYSSGAKLFITLYAVRHSLKRMRCGAGNQCKRSRIRPDTWEYFLVPQLSMPQKHWSHVVADQEHTEVFRPKDCYSNWFGWWQNSLLSSLQSRMGVSW